MRKVKYVGLLALAGVAVLGATLTSCSNDSGTSVYISADGKKVEKLGELDLLFKENSSIPYISLEDGTNYMSLVRSANLDDKKYKFDLNKVGNSYVISNETGGKCTLDVEKQTLTYNDYDKFTSIVPDTQKPLSMIIVKKNYKPISVVSNDYTAGKTLEISLKDYSLLDIYEKDNKAYLPLSVYNSVLLNVCENINLSYNGKNLFFISGDGLTDTSYGIPEETELAKKFREGASKTEISKEYMNYYYQSLCFDFNNEYGLPDKFNDFENNFDKFLEKYFKKDILSTDPKRIDKYTGIALTWLSDGHTDLTEFSNMYEFGDNQLDDTKMEPIRQNLEKLGDEFKQAKKEAEVKNGLEYIDDTVFVAFNSFERINQNKLYSKSDEDDSNLDDFTGIDGIVGIDFDFNFNKEPDDTAKLFNNLWSDLNSDKYKGKINNIVVDLTTNVGGSADALIYSLSTLLGNVSVDMTNPRTGGHNKQVFKADINADGKIDSIDKPLIESGYNIFFLDSQYSFSSANAMPYIAKLNNSNVTTLGAKTAGGPCAVRTYITPIGSVYSSSSLSVISKLENGKYVNIDDGIKADYELTEEKMLDRNYIAQYINNLKK